MQASAVLTADARRLVAESKELRERARAVRNYFRDAYHEAPSAPRELGEVREFLGDFGSELRDIELHRAMGVMDEGHRELVEASHAMLSNLDRMLGELTSLMDEVSATGTPRDRQETVDVACVGPFEVSPRKRRRNRWRAW